MELSAPAVCDIARPVVAEVTADTSGNCCRNSASNSSPGFAELVLCRNMSISGKLASSKQSLHSAFLRQYRASLVIKFLQSCDKDRARVS